MPDIALDGQPYVFISYASADRERVLDVVAALREAGIDGWIDQHGIEGGAIWGQRISTTSASSVMVSSVPLYNRQESRCMTDV